MSTETSAEKARRLKTLDHANKVSQLLLDWKVFRDIMMIIDNEREAKPSNPNNYSSFKAICENLPNPLTEPMIKDVWEEAKQEKRASTRPCW